MESDREEVAQDDEALTQEHKGVVTEMAAAVEASSDDVGSCTTPPIEFASSPNALRPTKKVRRHSLQWRGRTTNEAARNGGGYKS